MTEKFPSNDPDEESNLNEQCDPLDLVLPPYEEDQWWNEPMDPATERPSYPATSYTWLTIAQLRQVQDPSSDPSTYDPLDFVTPAEGMYDPLDFALPPDVTETGPESDDVEGTDPNPSS
jgi:hypothetical protein